MLSESNNETFFIEDLQADFKFLTDRGNNLGPSYEGLWGERLKIWFYKLSSNGRLDPKKLKSFRTLAPLISEVPRNPYHNLPILSQIYKFLRLEGYRRTCLLNYSKLATDKSLDWDSFDHVGEPLYLERDGRSFNERSLRHLRTVSIIANKIPLQPGDYVLDVGGGYAQFAMSLRRKYPKIKCIVIDFPEQLLLARYYIQSLDPNCSVNSIRDVYQSEDFVNDMSSLDVVLLPADSYTIINKITLKLVCNFSSFGEMPKNIFEEYQAQKAIAHAEYLFTINRLDSFPTYSNRTSIIDYVSHKGRIKHLEVSPIWDYYFSSFSRFWIKKKAFLSRNFELIEHRQVENVRQK